MKCPVCGNDTFDEEDYEYEICPECFWEYDISQVNNPDLAGGANNHSLNGYKKIYEGLKKDNPQFSCQNESDRKKIVMMDKNTEDEELVWEEVSTEHIVQDEWIDFRKTAFRFPDGNVFEPFYTYSRRDYVVVVAEDEEGRLICVKQFRQGIREVTTEFPAGGIEREDGKQYGSNSSAEDALEAAKRELIEETGYESDEWEHLISIPSNATIADNWAHIYAARNCRKISDQSLDEMEFLNVKLLTPQEIDTMIKEGNFKQAMHVMAWLMFNK
ncbi:MAG: NUDIX domain-containing protein [Eubacterium sp.]|nr:NUDIX domain-containing protein [Eubacterium sp.]